MLRMAWNCLPGLLSFHLDYCLVGTATGPHIHAILVVLITASHLVSHSKPIWGRRPEWVFRLHASAFASVRSSVFAVQAFVGANWLKGLCPTCKIRKYRIQLCSSSTLSSNINYCDKTVAFVKSVTAKSNHSGQGQFFYHCNFRFVFDRLQTLKILSNLEGGSVDFLSPFPKKLYHVLIAYKVYLGTSWGLDASYFLSCLNFLMLKGLVELQHWQFCLKVTISCWEWYIKRRKDPFLEPREA